MKWHIETVDLSYLKNHARNARKLSKHDADHLEKSIESFGLCEPIVANTDGTIIGGHQRARTLKKLKHKTAEVYFPENPLSDQQVDELNIRLNRNAGEWDFDMLANAWDSDDLLDWGFDTSDFGWTDKSDEGIPDSSEPKTLQITLTIPDEDAASFQNQLDSLLLKFPRVEKKSK